MTAIFNNNKFNLNLSSITPNKDTHVFDNHIASLFARQVQKDIVSIRGSQQEKKQADGEGEKRSTIRRLVIRERERINKVMKTGRKRIV